MGILKRREKGTATSAMVMISGKAKKTYKSKFFLTNMSNISKSIYEIGKKKRGEIYLRKGKQQFHNYSAMVKLFYLTYLTGARIGEMIRNDPAPKAEVIGYKGYTIVKITRQNQKNFQKSDKTKREIIISNFPVDEEFEVLMWTYIFDNGTNNNLDFLASFGGYEKRSAISHLIESNFRTDLTDGEKIYKQAGISPHILRHLRDFNLRVNKGYPREVVKKLIGWHTEDMMDYYLQTTKTLRDMEQLQMLNQHFSSLEQQRIPKYKIGGDEEITS